MIKDATEYGLPRGSSTQPRRMTVEGIRQLRIRSVERIGGLAVYLSRRTTQFPLPSGALGLTNIQLRGQMNNEGVAEPLPLPFPSLNGLANVLLIPRLSLIDTGIYLASNGRPLNLNGRRFSLGCDAPPMLTSVMELAKQAHAAGEGPHYDACISLTKDPETALMSIAMVTADAPGSVSSGSLQPTVARLGLRAILSEAAVA